MADNHQPYQRSLLSFFHYYLHAVTFLFSSSKPSSESFRTNKSSTGISKIHARITALSMGSLSYRTSPPQIAESRLVPRPEQVRIPPVNWLPSFPVPVPSNSECLGTASTLPEPSWAQSGTPSSSGGLPNLSGPDPPTSKSRCFPSPAWGISDFQTPPDGNLQNCVLQLLKIVFLNSFHSFISLISVIIYPFF